jgi:PAS domain S-box-containing protein
MEKYTSFLESPQLLAAYETAIDANIITSITDLNGTIVYANQKFCDISKYALHELIGENQRIVNSDYHQKSFFTDMWQTIKRGDIWHKEIKNKARDGTYYWVDTVIVPVFDDSGQISNYLSLRTLITDRKTLQEKNSEYLSSLEILLVKTSMNIRRPLENCMKEMNAINYETLDNNELIRIIGNLKSVTTELTGFTNKLSTFIRDIQK